MYRSSDAVAPVKLYHYALVFYVTFVYFANIPWYVSQQWHTSYVSLVPGVIFGYYFMALVLVSIVGFTIVEPRATGRGTRVLIWSLGYLLVILAWYPGGAGDDSVLTGRLTSLGYLVAFTMLFAGDDRVRTAARWAIVLAVVLGVANNAYDFLNPFYFTPKTEIYSNPGRAAGFYINANRASAALLIGAAITVAVIPEKLRSIYVLLAGLGVVLTFSRMGIIGWGILVAILLLQRSLSLWRFAFATACVGGLIVAAVPAMSYFQSLGIDSQANIEGRVEWFASAGRGQDDESLDERRAVAVKAMEMIAEKPLVGSGTGATQTWSEDRSTHDMYLMHMVEYGFVGVVILPLLVIASVWGSSGETWQVAVSFGAMVLFMSLFSHNVLDEYHYLIGFALMGSMASRSALGSQPMARTSATQRTRLGLQIVPGTEV